MKYVDFKTAAGHFIAVDVPKHSDYMCDGGKFSIRPHGGNREYLPLTVQFIGLLKDFKEQDAIDVLGYTPVGAPVAVLRLKIGDNILSSFYNTVILKKR